MAQYAILTISDRGAAGKQLDLGGNTIIEMMSLNGHKLVSRCLLPDERFQISNQLRSWAANEAIDLILTTGGTGISPRDVTPEATKDVIDYEVPGLTEAMRAASFRITPMALLSRAIAGVKNSKLIINLPGNPHGVEENLQIILPVLDHAVEILTGSHSGPHPT